MGLVLTHTDEPCFKEYEENLGKDLAIYMDKNLLDKRLRLIRQKEITAAYNLKSYMSVKSGYSFSLGKDNIVNFLLNVEKINPFHITDKKTAKYSLNKDKLLLPMLSRGVGKEFLYWYFPYIRYKTMRENMNSMRKRMKDVEDGLLKITYMLEGPAATGRYYTKSDNVQAIPLEFLDCLTVEKDWYLVWGDFAQIDFRVAYNTILKGCNEEHDQVFFSYKDKYEALSRIIHKLTDTEFNYNVFKKDRNKYKVATLARFYGSNINQLYPKVLDREFLDSLEIYFKTNKKYQEFTSNLSTLCKLNVDICMRDYFNVERVISRSEHSFRKKNMGLNFPIQATSNSIIMHTVNSILREFESRGVRDKIEVYLVRHDEPLFKVHKDALKHLDVIKNHSYVYVDDWDVLTMEGFVGKRYLKPDPNIMKEFNSISVRSVEPPGTHYNYLPLKKTCVYALELIDGVYYVMREDTKEYFKFNTSNDLLELLGDDGGVGVEHIFCNSKFPYRLITRGKDTFIFTDKKSAVKGVLKSKVKAERKVV